MGIVTIIGDFIEKIIRFILIWFTGFLPVKVIRNDNGEPFLYRYHLFAFTNDGPGMCIHRFVKSDPDRGYHDHPWTRAMSFILAGGYEERMLILYDMPKYNTYKRKRFTFNYLKGHNNFHRVMLEEGKDAWTIFWFGKRSKTWGMIDLENKYHAMSTKVMDGDGGWWNHVKTGNEIRHRMPNIGNVVTTVDIIVKVHDQLLLIKRGKDPYKDAWAFPGGRVEDKDEDLESAAMRELREETNIEIDREQLKQIVTVGNNKRDPRGFCTTIVYLLDLKGLPDSVKAGDDAVGYKWFKLTDLPDMAFDHREILSALDEK